MEKTPVLESLFNKAADLKACIFIKKEIPTQMFCCEYWKVFKNRFLVQRFLLNILFRNFM